MDSASGHHHNNHPMHNHVWGDLEVEEKVIEQLLDSSVTHVSGSEQQPPDSPLPEDGVRRVRFNANSKIASYPSEKSLSEEEEEEEYVDSSDDDYEEEGEEGEEGEENSSGEEEEGTFSDDEVVITDHDSGELPFIQQGNGQQTLVGQSSSQHTPTDTPTPTPTPTPTSKSSSGSPTLAQSIETLSSISSAQQAGITTEQQQDQPQQQQSPPQRRWFQQRQAIQRYTPRYKSAPQQQEQQQQKEGEDSSVDGNSNNSNSNGANATPSSHTPQQQPGQSQHPQQAQEKPLVVQQLERAKLELNQEIARAKEASENLTISSAKLQESLSHLSDRIAISRSLLAALG